MNETTGAVAATAGTHAKGADPAQRVGIIGAGKSALDCAAWAAREGKTSTLV